MLPDVSEFKKFYDLLMSGSPRGYIPHLFVLEQKNKDPLSTRPWSSPASRLSFDKAIRFLIYGYNIGIAAMSDELVLIDVDDTNAIPESDIKPTLSVITRSRVGSHNYYFTEDPQCKVNIPTDHGEIRSRNQYLVCPGSFVTTDISTVPRGQEEMCGYYTIHNPIPPTQITFDEFPQVFKDQQYKINHTAPQQKPTSSGRVSRSALFSLTLSDIISYPKNKPRFPSPFHSSDSGANASVSNGIIHCWRHLCAHNPLQALSVIAGMYTCQRAGVSHRNGGSGGSELNLADGKTLYALWDFARRRHYIPADDPPPRAALRFFVIKSGLCREDELIDGWRIPEHIYREARYLLSTNL